MYNYEATIWGRGTAGNKLDSPTHFRLKKSLEAISDLTQGQRVLEIGSGAGQFIRAVKQIRPDLNCFGCDLSKSAIYEAQNYHDGVSYSNNEDELPYDNCFFNAILIYDVLEHVEEPGKFLQEANRVLQKGGVLYAFVPCEGDIMSLWNLLDKFGLKKDLTKKHAGHIQYFSRGQLLRLFQESGFQLSKIYYSEHFLGQIAGIATFYLMDKYSRDNNIRQINNENYFSNKRGKIFGIIRSIGNIILNLESLLLKKIPSPNVHFILKKI